MSLNTKEEWQCVECTFLQPSSNNNCSLCNAPHVQTLQSSNITASPNAENIPLQEYKEYKEPFEDEEERNEISEETKAEEKSFCLQLELDEETEWQCSKCTLIQSFSSSMECIACGNDNRNNSFKADDNLVTDSWMNLGECVFFDAVMEICSNIIKDNKNENNNSTSNYSFIDDQEFVIRLQSLGMTSDYSQSRAMNMLEMIRLENEPNPNSNQKKKYNTFKNPEKNLPTMENAMICAPDLKQWMKKKNIWEKDLFLVLVSHHICEIPLHLHLIDSWFKFAVIVRQVRVLRRQELKSVEAKLRLDRICTKFEKLWMKETGIRKTNILPSQMNRRRKANGSKKHGKNKNNVLYDNNGKGQELRQWMKKNEVWEQYLFEELLMIGIDSEKKLKLLNKKSYKKIMRKVKVHKFSELKDQKSRQRCDKLLVSFEKKYLKLCKKKM